MTLYSKLEKHLPREKECVPEEYADLIINENTGFNACKAQYDEVLRRVVVDEEKIAEIIDSKAMEWYPYGDRIPREKQVELLAKAIANSTDVFKVEEILK